MLKSPIETSIFEIFQCGPGPSSSHTIGPIKAGLDIRQLCLALDEALPDNEAIIKVVLYGSLSATGKGHGTPAAIIAGLMGYHSSECPDNLLREIEDNPQKKYEIQLEHCRAYISYEDVVFGEIHHNFKCANTLEISLNTVTNELLFTRRYYSLGGGFITWDNCKRSGRRKPVHGYTNMRQIKNLLKHSGFTLAELMAENESAITGISRPVI